MVVFKGYVWGCKKWWWYGERDAETEKNEVRVQPLGFDAFLFSKISPMCFGDFEECRLH